MDSVESLQGGWWDHEAERHRNDRDSASEAWLPQFDNADDSGTTTKIDAMRLGVNAFTSHRKVTSLPRKVSIVKEGTGTSALTEVHRRRSSLPAMRKTLDLTEPVSPLNRERCVCIASRTPNSACQPSSCCSVLFFLDIYSPLISNARMWGFNCSVSDEGGGVAMPTISSKPPRDWDSLIHPLVVVLLSCVVVLLAYAWQLVTPTA
jgi:hypothetical protein